MADETTKLRAALLQREETLATLNKERAAMLKDIDRFKENMKRGDMELRKAVGACACRARLAAASWSSLPQQPQRAHPFPAPPRAAPSLSPSPPLSPRQA